MDNGGENKQAEPTVVSPTSPAHVRLRFDRGTHPDPVARAHAWCVATSVSMETAFEPGDLNGFAGSVHVRPIGPYLLADLSLSTGTILRQRSTRIRWEHDHVILDLIVTGALTGLIGGTSVSLKAGDCATVDLRGGMRLCCEDARFIGLVIPRSLFVRQAGTGVAIDGRVFEATSAEAQALGSLLGSLVAQAERLADPVAAALAQAAVDILVACMTPRRQRWAGGSDAATSGKPPTLAQLRRFIDRYAAGPEFDAETICTRFGLSRTALYRIFAPAGGVAEAIRRRRAAIAVRLLAQPGATTLKIPKIAQASGFGTERSLRNAVRDLYGVSPREIIRNGIAAVSKHEPLDQEIGRMFDEL